MIANRAFRFSVIISLLIGSVATAENTNAGMLVKKTEIEEAHQIYAIHFVNNRFNSPCADTEVIRSYNKSMQIISSSNKSCEIHVDSEMKFEPDGMNFEILDSLMVLRSKVNNNSIIFRIMDISSVHQSIELLNGEPNEAKKALTIVAAILIPAAVLVGVLFVMMANSSTQI